MSNSESSFPPSPDSSTPAASRIPWFRLLALGAVLIALAAAGTWWSLRDPDAQELVVRGQTELALGSPAGLRILVRHRTSGQPVAGARIEVSLRGKPWNQVLGRYVTGADGSLSEPLAIPDVPPGDYELAIVARSPLGRDNLIRKVRLVRPGRLLLTTDKPLYQPSQTIHLRTLALNTRTGKPLSGQPITFEVADGKGNKVFKETQSASRFGIASADFVLASEVNVGRYQVRAQAGSFTAERTIEVKPYVLPRFKLSIATDQPWYRPGQTVSGSVSAQYLFGKPVAAATVELTAETFHEQPVQIGSVRGTADADGKFGFQLALPQHFVGLPQKGGQAFLELTARVLDSAGHVESANRSLTVAATDLTLTLLPEGGALVPGVENRLYVLAAYPDGTPAACELGAAGASHRTDATGVAELSFRPAPGRTTFTISARDAAGRVAEATLGPEAGATVTSLLVRTDRAVYEAGQRAQVAVLSAGSGGTVFVDLVRGRQTVLTHSLNVEQGRGELALDLPPDLTGLLRINAYTITSSGEDRGSSRLIYVRPATALVIRAQADRAVYQPGETARVQVSVRDPQGRPTPTALGICAVDESLFALHEHQPGLLAQLLATESELMKPRYQLKFFDAPARLLGSAGGNPLLAQAYLAAMDREQGRSSVDAAELEANLGPAGLARVRRWQGTPEFEVLRNDPQHAEAIRFIEGQAGRGDWQERTGPAKQRAAEQRRARFQAAASAGTVVLVALLMVGGGFWLLLDNRFARVRLNDTPLSGPDRRWVELVFRQHLTLGVLFLFQLCWYPAVTVLAGLCELRGGASLGYAWLAGETVAVCAVLGWGVCALESAKRWSPAEPADLRTLGKVLAWYAAQFVVTRLAISEATWGTAEPSGIIVLWFLLALVLPCAVLAYSTAQTRRLAAARGIQAGAHLPSRWGEVAVVIVVLFLLAGLLLPALAKAKAKSQRINAANDLKQLGIALELSRSDREDGRGASVESAGPHLRRFFPETLFWRPEVITDDRGEATLEIPLADSITTWRASLDAISADGRLGSTELPLRVFQDFFIEADLPVSLSLGDRISVPVMCYNYLATPQTVRLMLARGEWFAAAERDLSQTLTLAPNEVRAVRFPIETRKVGTHRFTVTAQGGKTSDAVEREVRVAPTGEAIEWVENGVLRDRVQFTFNVAPEAIPDSASLVLKLYPSRFSEIVEGLDNIFQAPYGCFEQTSSTTYPNALALDYLKSAGRLSPELEVKARKYITAGYQRLLTFEVPGGGFDWFGQSPANVCLSAYGILEFSDLARVHAVDRQVIERASAWLAGQQQADGAWTESHRGWTWGGRGSITAFVAWALAESGRPSASLDKALAYLRQHADELDTPYAQALAANALLARNSTDGFGRELAAKLARAAQHPASGQASWTSRGASMTFSTGLGLEVETTALAAMALIQAGNAPQTVKEALTWVSARKAANGTWGSTQATILAMRALLKASGTALGQDFTSNVRVWLNGEAVDTIAFTPATSDVLRLISLTKRLRSGDNRVELRQEPRGDLPYQAASVYWVPARPSQTAKPPSPAELEITLEYDRTTLAVNDTLHCTVTAANRTPHAFPMAMVDLGIPPGFEVDRASFERMQAEGLIGRYELTGNQVILYLRELKAGPPLRFRYALHAKYPLRVATPRSSLYEYYTPEKRAWAKPASLEVTP